MAPVSGPPAVITANAKRPFNYNYINKGGRKHSAGQLGNFTIKNAAAFFMKEGKSTASVSRIPGIMSDRCTKTFKSLYPPEADQCLNLASWVKVEQYR